MALCDICDAIPNHAEFSSFTASLNAEMKRLQSMGIGSNRRQAEPLTNEEEELLWGKKIVGDHTPQTQ